MRLTLLVTAGVLAASIGLSACSSGANQAVPGASQSTTSSMGHHALRFVAIGAKPDASCPSQFFLCVTLTGKKATMQGICISSTGSCSTPAPGTWTWSGSAAVTKTGKAFPTIKGSYDPNPGNPTTITFKSKKKLKATKGVNKYEWNLEACDSSSSCAEGSIGISIKK